MQETPSNAEGGVCPPVSTNGVKKPPIKRTRKSKVSAEPTGVMDEENAPGGDTLLPSKKKGAKRTRKRKEKDVASVQYDAVGVGQPSEAHEEEEMKMEIVCKRCRKEKNKTGKQQGIAQFLIQRVVRDDKNQMSETESQIGSEQKKHDDYDIRKEVHSEEAGKNQTDSESSLADQHKLKAQQDDKRMPTDLEAQHAGHVKPPSTVMKDKEHNDHDDGLDLFCSQCRTPMIEKKSSSAWRRSSGGCASIAKLYAYKKTAKDKRVAWR
jgi:hypothetical protein